MKTKYSTSSTSVTWIDFWESRKQIQLTNATWTFAEAQTTNCSLLYASSSSQLTHIFVCSLVVPA